MSLFIVLIVIFACLLSVYSLQPKAFGREAVLKPFAQGNALKIISGLHNFDQGLVKNVAWASNLGGASHIDIACDPVLVKLAKSVANIPICVSSVTPVDFVAAVEVSCHLPYS